jgi:tetratricopeptide (TPR) repeat protein
VDLMLCLAQLSGDECLIEETGRFAVGRHGSDDVRMRALMTAGAEIAETALEVRMWSRGQQINLQTFHYDIYTDAQPDDMSPTAYSFYAAALKSQQRKKYREAEAYLRHAVALAPDNPTLRNNLAAALDGLGQHDEAAAQLEELHRRNPEYLFARCNVAKRRAKDGDLGAAKELLKPVLRTKRLHVTEFTAMCGAQILIHSIEGNADGVERWAGMLRKVDPDAPELRHLRFMKQLEAVTKRAMLPKPSPRSRRARE